MVAQQREESFSTKREVLRLNEQKMGIGNRPKLLRPHFAYPTAAVRK